MGGWARRRAAKTVMGGHLGPWMESGWTATSGSWVANLSSFLSPSLPSKRSFLHLWFVDRRFHSVLIVWVIH